MTNRNGIQIIVVDRDIYARQAIKSYLSWDRCTHVIGTLGSIDELFTALQSSLSDIFIDVLILDTTLVESPAELHALILKIREAAPKMKVICLAHVSQETMSFAARSAGVLAYLVKENVGIGIASAVRYALSHEFVVTQNTFPGTIKDENSEVKVLPSRRKYPRLTQRIEQALWLCVIEGLPADLAAYEMKVSVSTVRSYIKEGYRILEAADKTDYPADASPAERAFMRYSALNIVATPTEIYTMEPVA